MNTSLTLLFSLFAISLFSQDITKSYFYKKDFEYESQVYRIYGENLDDKYTFVISKVDNKDTFDLLAIDEILVFQNQLKASLKQLNKSNSDAQYMP